MEVRRAAQFKMGVESEAVKFPCETGSIVWPNLNLTDILLPLNHFPNEYSPG
jgi:hypothetical protein